MATNIYLKNVKHTKRGVAEEWKGGEIETEKEREEEDGGEREREKERNRVNGNIKI